VRRRTTTGKGKLVRQGGPFNGLISKYGWFMTNNHGMSHVEYTLTFSTSQQPTAFCQRAFAVINFGKSASIAISKYTNYIGTRGEVWGHVKQGLSNRERAHFFFSLEENRGSFLGCHASNCTHIYLFTSPNITKPAQMSLGISFP
jgi:hypothetical protein